MANAKEGKPAEELASPEDPWAEIHATHTQMRQTVRVPLRSDLADRIEQLEEQARREHKIDERENRDPLAPKLAEQIQQLEAELAESEREFVFEAIGRRPYLKLIADHPPTDEQKADAEESGAIAQYDAETFSPALLAASCVEPPGATLETMTRIWNEWSAGQVSRLWSTCLAANLGSADAGPKSVIASEILHGSSKS